VDNADAHLLMHFVWSAKKDGRAFYAYSNTYARHTHGRLHANKLHQAILPEKQRIDHKDHNGLDCRRINIREATSQQNGRNRLPELGGISRFNGVSWAKRERKWLARLSLGERRLRLGFFELEEDAALAYNFSAHEHFGEFARFNRA
jgi:hypothetical protein